MYQLRITIDDITPQIWRTIQIPGTYSLNKLHHIIQIAFGWTNSHLYCFIKNNITISNQLVEIEEPVVDDRRVKIKDVFNEIGDRLPYEYDFGDSWQHTIKLEKIEEGGLKAPRCLDGARAAPPEDCGGVHGYKELIHHLLYPEKDGYIELLEWLDDDYDSEAFDLHGVNMQLKSLAKYIRTFDEENGLTS